MPLLMHFHWLQVHDCIVYKVAVLIYKCVIGSAPEYLRDLEVKDHGCSPRSPTTMKLPISHSRTSFAQNSSFASMGPQIWNALPYQLTTSWILETFMKGLETFYMQEPTNKIHLFYVTHVLT